MLDGFRQAVYNLIALDLKAVAVWHTVPDDIAELPCVVVGRPAATESPETKMAFDMSLEVFVLARRQQAGDYEKELLTLADEVWTVLGGTKGHRDVDGYPLTLRALLPRILTVASNEIIAYAIEVQSSEITC